MIVVDSSVVVAATTDVGPDGEWSRRLIASDELAAPHLFGVEVLSTIRRLELSGLLDESLASLAAADAIGVPVSGVPFDADRVWDLRHTVTVQDACYVSVAELIDAPLATLDPKLAAAPGPRCRFLLPSAH